MSFDDLVSCCEGIGSEIGIQDEAGNPKYIYQKGEDCYGNLSSHLFLISAFLICDIINNK
jgi:hypothetical protein